MAGASGISEIIGLGGKVSITNLGGASILRSNDAVRIAMGTNGAMHTFGDSSVVFKVAENKITSVEDFGGGMAAVIEGNLNGLEIDGKYNFFGQEITISGESAARSANADVWYKVENGSITAISGLNENSSLKGSVGSITVNGTKLTPEENDIIIGLADGTAAILSNSSDDNSDASDFSEPISADNTIDEIEEILGLAEYATAATVADSINIKDDIWDTALEITSNNSTAKELKLDFSKKDDSKKVILQNGLQSVKFNDDGNNEAVVEDSYKGAKSVTLGNGGEEG